jgi:hypothetical protein
MCADRTRRCLAIQLNIRPAEEDKMNTQPKGRGLSNGILAAWAFCAVDGVSGAEERPASLD